MLIYYKLYSLNEYSIIIIYYNSTLYLGGDNSDMATQVARRAEPYMEEHVKPATIIDYTLNGTSVTVTGTYGADKVAVSYSDITNNPSGSKLLGEHTEFNHVMVGGGYYSATLPESIPLTAGHTYRISTKTVGQYGDYRWSEPITFTVPKPSEPVVSSGFVFPVKGNYPIICRFGYCSCSAHGRQHNGIDIQSPKGAIIVACADGIVEETYESSQSGGYGRRVVIKHNITDSNGRNIYSTYSHLDSISVKKGDIVLAGDEIGKCGSTGNSTGPHLHFEIGFGLWGPYINPFDYIPSSG